MAPWHLPLPAFVRKPVAPLSLIGIAALVISAGCQPVTTGGAITKDGKTSASLIATEYKFSPAEIKMPGPGELTVSLKNAGVIEHDFQIEGLPGAIKTTAGQTAQAVFVIEKGGRYTFFCSISGHRDAGMVGTIEAGDVKASEPDKAPPAAAVSIAPADPNAKPLPRPQVAPPVSWSEPRTHQLTVEVKETVAQLADGVTYKFWTFGGTVPGPMLRVREGDTVELTLKNAPDSEVTHSIDLHAVTGPGGGAKVTQVAPGKDATFRFQALNPGVYVYHCATTMVANHIANGMYGMIVVEPKAGLAPVDHEYYLMQGDIYVKGKRGQAGAQEFSLEKLLDERPDYVVFDGGVGALTGANALQAKVGETVRIFFGVGGPNLSSSFHVIGEIFDRVYPQGASEAQTNVQTTTVPPGGATMVEFRLQVPGDYTIVDHSLGRLEKGAAAILHVDGPDNPEVFQPLQSGAVSSGN